jgi:dienelactone hydrolase
MLLVTFVLTAVCAASAQQEHLTCASSNVCCTLHYSDVLVTSDILYGRAANLTNNAAVDLYMDMYRASSATGKLPVIIAVHGGGYDVVETKLNMHITNHARTWASKGFLVFSIEYRRHWPWKNQAGIRLIQDPVHDMLAAVRYVRQNHEVLQADPENIGLQGCSAGAITAMNANAFDMGEGESGSPGVSSAFNFVISISGGVSYAADLATFGMPSMTFPPYKSSAHIKPVLGIVNEGDVVAYRRELASYNLLTQSAATADLILLPGSAHCPLISTPTSSGQTVFESMLAFALTHTGGCRRAVTAPDGDGPTLQSPDADGPAPDADDVSFANALVPSSLLVLCLVSASIVV